MHLYCIFVNLWLAVLWNFSWFPINVEWDCLLMASYVNTNVNLFIKHFKNSKNCTKVLIKMEKVWLHACSENQNFVWQDPEQSLEELHVLLEGVNVLTPSLALQALIPEPHCLLSLPIRSLMLSHYTMSHNISTLCEILLVHTSPVSFFVVPVIILIFNK